MIRFYGTVVFYIQATYLWIISVMIPAYIYAHVLHFGLAVT